MSRTVVILGHKQIHWRRKLKPGKWSLSAALIAFVVSATLLSWMKLESGSAQEAPYPPSPVISGIDWAPSNTILYKADGSDTWPVTWADDGHVYTAFGDGWGFDPKVPDKLSLGLAVVESIPSNFQGTNLRSSSGERTGDGASGPKASGMLMVDGVLYMAVRNADRDGQECTLAWSEDHAKTWTWANWRFPELGYCALLNFGQNYTGARDNYVYLYSPDTPSAYNETDHAVLARVPKDRIREKDAYQFFTGLDGNENPTWSSNVADRKPVFTFPGGVNRLDVAYNAPLGRYLMTMRSRARAGGHNQFSIYDAPEPWGPWTTVYYTETWDGATLSTTNGGWGEAQHIPTKWISEDGKSFYLVFSGDDSFAVRKATLTVRSQSTSGIQGITWDFSTHRRLAGGSDNWPITWADDNHQYTSWGDGGGFGGTGSDGRVSLGFGRVQGDWDDYQGFNVWGGKNPENPASFGGKSYGMISVDGVLYAWWGPGSGDTFLDETKLLRSSDRGKTWQQSSWAFTKEQKIFAPTFLNFGQDNAGARDGFVYAYFPRLNSSRWGLQRPGMVDLARVPKDRVMDQSAYEWFAGLDSSDNPNWTSDVNSRQPVLEDPNGVWIPAVTYNIPLQQYILVTEHAPERQANLGFFVASEPWGPWQTIEYYTNWGDGRFTSGRGTLSHYISPKWISSDGRDFTLVFTHDDSWNTVRGRFTTSGEPPSPTPTPSPAPTATPPPTPAPTATPDQIVSSLSVASGESYRVVSDGLASGATVYIDRDYSFTGVPADLLAATYIQTANDDKTASSTDFLSFDVNQDVTVYVAYDIRATSLPAWLDSWTETGQILGTTDTGRMLYSRTFPAGEVTLGGNLTSGASGADSNYSVIVAGTPSSGPPPNQAPEVSISSPADRAIFQAGDSITFNGSATDPEDGPLTGSALVWASSRDGQVGTGHSVTTTLSAGDHTITLSATDRQGATATASVGITIQPPGTATLTVGSATGLPGASVEVPVTLDTRGTPVRSLRVNLAYQGAVLPQAAAEAGAGLPSGWDFSWHSPEPGDLRLIALAPDADGQPMDGVVFTAVFTIAAEAAESETPVVVALQEVRDSANTVLEVTASGGSVTVSSAFVYGDANGDGEFNTADVNELVDWMLGRTPTPELGTVRFAAADVDGGGVINSADTNLMVDRLLGRIGKFPIQ